MGGHVRPVPAGRRAGLALASAVRVEAVSGNWGSSRFGCAGAGVVVFMAASVVNAVA